MIASHAYSTLSRPRHLIANAPLPGFENQTNRPAAALETRKKKMGPGEFLPQPSSPLEDR
jgi:hypothetical protein